MFKMKSTLQFIKPKSSLSNMKGRNLVLLMLFVFTISFISAYDGIPRYDDLGVSLDSNNATACNVTWFQQANGTVTQLDLVLTKSGRTFTGVINGGNFSQLGDIGFGLSCTDGITYETGDRAYTVTANGENSTANTVFFVFIITIMYSLSLTAFFGRNIPFTILTGMGLLFLGVYLQNNGIIIFQDTLTNYFGIITWAWGGLSAIWATLEQFDAI